MENIKQIGGRVGLGFAALSAVIMTSVVLAGSASAADPVTTAFTEMESKVTTYGGLVVGLVVLAVGIFLGIRWLRKGVNAA